jgi:hypothetical protein
MAFDVSLSDQAHSSGAFFFVSPSRLDFDVDTRAAVLPHATGPALGLLQRGEGSGLRSVLQG